MSKPSLKHLLQHIASTTEKGKSEQEPPPVLGIAQDPTARILKVPGGFACGLCSKQHQQLDNAYACLQTCTLQRRLKSPVSTHPAVAGMVHNCGFCARSYKNAADAESCARRCLSAQKIPASVHQAVTDAQTAHLRANLVRVRKPLERRVTPRPTPEQFSSFQPAAESRQQITQDQVSEPPDTSWTVSADPLPPAAPLPPPAQRELPVLEDVAREDIVLNTDGLLYRKRGQKPFKRMDAKYGCSVCNELFFTKSEVEACFEAHPLLDPDV